MINDLPFIEQGSTRIFSAATDPSTLHWHYDEQDRTVTILEAGDWSFQDDNMLPFKLVNRMKIFIPAGKYHRLHKGNSELKIKIEKHENL